MIEKKPQVLEQKLLSSFIAKVKEKQSTSSDLSKDTTNDLDDSIKTESEMPKLTIPPPPPIFQQVKKKDNSVVAWMNVADGVAKAEALWAMKTASSNFSFSSSDGTSNLFQDMFPDSMIAKQFTMSHQKASYLVSHGIGPYFQKTTVNEILSSEVYYTIHFDETVTNQSKKQMDVLIRYFSENSACVQVRYLCSLFFGHAFVKIVCKNMLNCLTNLKLPLKKLLCLSADGPNVNKSIKATMDTAVKEAGAPGLVDVGFCFIHKVHNAFKAGNNVFGVKALDFVISVFTWFHMYPAREEDFQLIQEDEFGKFEVSQAL